MSAVRAERWLDRASICGCSFLLAAFVSLLVDVAATAPDWLFALLGLSAAATGICILMALVSLVPPPEDRT